MTRCIAERRSNVASRDSASTARVCGSSFAFALLTACSAGGDDTLAQAPFQKGAIGVYLTPASMTLAPGATSGAGITITRGTPFLGPVTLTATGVPAGVTVTFSPVTVSLAMRASMAVSIAAGATPVNAEVSIVGSNGNIVSLPAKLTLRIQ